MIYLIQNLANDQIKIGYSQTPHKRLRQLQVGSGDRLKLIRDYTVKNDRLTEKRLHKMFWQSKRRGEWFQFIPLDDYLDLIDELLSADQP